MKKNLEMMTNVFFINVKKKIIKHFAEKSFNVFGGAHGRPLNTLELFWQNVLFFFLTLMKNAFAIRSRFFSPKFAGII